MAVNRQTDITNRKLLIETKRSRPILEHNEYVMTVWKKK